MALPRLDPRMNSDRIYQYEDYHVLSATFSHKRKRRPFGILSQKRVAVRLLPYKIAIAAGLLVILSAVAGAAYLDADTAKLAYDKTGYQAKLAGIQQDTMEARGDQLSQERNVLSSAEASTAKVVYPANTQYLVLTNIPDADGHRLVEELYPLSASIIQIGD